MNIRYFQIEDYQDLVELYKKSDQFSFDPVTDSEENLRRKITRDPRSILVAEENNRLISSVSIIEDGRIALLFRLIVDNESEDKEKTLTELVEKAEAILKDRGYQQVHNTAPANKQEAVTERLQVGFKQGSDYTWFWKELD